MEDPIVEVEQGQIRGCTGTDLDGELFYKFLGIPYAKPPLGPLRFKAPLPPDPWSGIRDAQKEGNACYARHMLFKSFIGNEDCLILNVFTPTINNSTCLRPVMVWIHGGGFTTGSNNTELYGPEYLIAEDVVLVTINYRLGILGFLCLENSELKVPGNAGLKDIVMALKWVQKNIKAFSGDPNNVTIFGESAGAFAVHFFILSPMANGLFHKAICQSGTALVPRAIGRRCSKQIAKIFNVDSNNEKKLLDHLQNLSVEELVQTSEKLVDVFAVNVIKPFGPVIEKESSEPQFLSYKPIDILKSGNYNKVPIIFGYTNREGMLSLSYSKENRKRLLADFETAIPYFFNLEKNSQQSISLAEEIKKFYFKESLDNMDSYFKLETDNFFLREIYNTVKLHVKTSKEKIFFYRMSIETKLNVIKKLTNIQLPGVTHGDDLGYLFKTKLSPNINPNDPEFVAVKRVTQFWTNFARFGDVNPMENDNNKYITIKWPTVNEKEVNFLDIGNQLNIGIDPDSERMVFWDTILQQNSLYYYT